MGRDLKGYDGMDTEQRFMDERRQGIYLILYSKVV
jgi:hypothetical protein